MYKFILVLLLPLVLLLTSCATTTSSKNYKTLSEQIGINEQGEEPEVAPKIEILDPLQNGPGTSTPKKRNPTIALFLGPGLYHAFAYVEVFKAFEKHKLPISMVSGSEFGLFLSALYAKHAKASLVEWRLFSLLQKMDEDESGGIYKENWRSFYEGLFKKEFSGDRIEKLKIPLVIPVFDSQKKVITFLEKGDVGKSLQSVLHLYPTKEASQISVIPYHVFPSKRLQEKGADLIIYIDALPQQIEFKDPDSFVMGVYFKVLSRVRNEKKSLPLHFNLGVKGFPLDELKDIPVYQGRVQRSMIPIIKKIKRAIEAWRIQ